MYIVPFAQMKAGDSAVVGKKALSLAELAQAGFRVPEGYVVSSDAFTKFLAENHLISGIHSELDKLNIQELHSVEYASRIIRDMIMGGDWPDELISEILQQFMHLNTEKVAVRSSVFSENGYSTAWAGELLTSLNVGMSALPEHIKQCWASLYSARSLYHLYQRRVKLEELHLAVIVQKMVPAIVSGLAYTVHPVHRDPQQMVIEAGLGLGEAIVSGKIVPDTYVLRKEPYSILEKTITTQTIAISAGSGEGTETRELPKPMSLQKLPDADIKRIATACLRLEEHYGKPVSVEWVLADDLYFVQARAIDLT
jgi:pyruvate,water dikinase